MHRHNCQSGSVAVECALALPLFTAVLMMVIHVGLLCIQRQSRIYDVFMAMRAQLLVQDVAYAHSKPAGDNPVCAGGGPC